MTVRDLLLFHCLTVFLLFTVSVGAVLWDSVHSVTLTVYCCLDFCLCNMSPCVSTLQFFVCFYCAVCVLSSDKS